MRELILGRSGIRVSELCLGTMMFDNAASWRDSADAVASRRIYDTYREAGGNFIDTADVYGNSEETLGQMIVGHRDEIVLATKFTLNGGSNRKQMRLSVEASLKRLRTDHVDLLWVHAWDQRTAIEETMRALDDLIAAGKVLAVGASNMPAWVISGAIIRAELLGQTPFSALQVEYSLIARTADREMLPMARAHGLMVTGWSPLGRGVLAGRDRPYASQRDREIARAVGEVAGLIGVSPSQVALAWALAKGVIPVIGATRPEQLNESIGAAALKLDDALIERLDAISAIDPGYPYDLLTHKMDLLGPI